jgi:CheY-like chemotaxis protein
VHPKLLLADDSVTIQRVIELTFADEDVQVLAVGDGQQAIDRVRTDRPDIVLADVGMPERDGYEVAAFIKGDPSLAHIPVLLLTGAFEPIDEARARAVGCDGVLVKPFEPQMVISRVRDLLAGRKGLASATPAIPASPAPQNEPAETPASLEDYFDRLDAALASKTASAPILDPVVPELATPALRPTLTVVPPIAETPAPPPHADLDLSGWNPPPLDAPAPMPRSAGRAAPEAPVIPVAPRPAPPTPMHVAAPSPAPESQPPALPLVSPSGPINLEEAFAALLAAEQGHPGPVQPGRAAAATPWAGDVPDSVVDAVVSKVLARMGDESMRAAVLDAAERLVREEIDRIKNVR